MGTALATAAGLIIVAIVTQLGQLLGSRNDRSLTDQELELLKKLDPKSPAAAALSDVIHSRIELWKDSQDRIASRKRKGSRQSVFGNRVQFAGLLAGLLGLLIAAVVGIQSLRAQAAAQRADDAARSITSTAANPGQIEGGNIVRVSTSLSPTPGESVTTPNSGEVTVAMRLANSGPSALVRPRVSAVLSAQPSRRITVVMAATAINAEPALTSDSATVEFTPNGEIGCLKYVPGSTVVRTTKGADLYKLSDGIAEGGVSLQTDLDTGLGDARIVQFRIAATSAVKC